jgi:hypothetical protein
LGQNSAEVASDRRLLGVIYTGLEKQKNGKFWVFLRIWSSQELMLQLCRLRWGSRKPLFINTLDGVVQLPDSKTRVLCNQGMFEDSKRILEIDEGSKTRVFISMGKALCNQGKLADQRRFLEIVWRILDKVKDGSYLLTPI